jgi:hypothetical protein
MDYYGDPQLESLVKFNAEMPTVTINMIET